MQYDDLMFNLHKDKQLVYYTKVVVGEDCCPFIENLRSNESLRRPLNRKMMRFIASLEVASYQKMTSYSFHDTLAALSKYVYSCQHREKFTERE